MRNHYLLFSALALLMSNLNLAQNAITLGVEDLPTVGKTLYIYHDTTSLYSTNINTEAGKSGANQNWDLTELKAYLTDTIDYVDPASTNYGDTFPSSTVCALSSMYNNAIFINTATNAYEIEGMVSFSSNLVLDYTTPSVLISYPTNYLDSSNTVSNIIYTTVYGKNVKINGLTYYADSMKKVNSYYTKALIDGYGTITTPGGSFNALRQYLYITTVKETYLLINGTWTLHKSKSVSSYKLRWWANGYSYPVVECSYYPNSGIVRSMSFVKAEETVVTAINKTENNSIIAYFNPNSDCFIISGITENSKLSVYNSNGSLVYEKTVLPNNIVDTKRLRKGIYFYSVLGTSGKVLDSGKFTITK